MEQVYRIEIPLEVINKMDPSTIRAAETVLQHIFKDAKNGKAAVQEMMNVITKGVSEARSSMQQTASAAQKSAQAVDETEKSVQNTTDAMNDLGDAADDTASAVQKLPEGWYYDLNGRLRDARGHFATLKKAAEESAQGVKSSFGGAGQHVDKFTERVEKSQRSIRKMLAQKMQLTLAAIDKVSPILKSVGSSLKNITSKAWHVAVRMTDLVTAPFRKLVQMISNPIAMTISLAGVGLSASSFLNTFTDFSAGMSNVKALSGATEEEFARLTASAENLGATTKFTAAEASQGMQYLAMAGWDTAEIIDAMPGMLNLAAAGATDLGTAADIVSDVMTAMDMQASEATRASDVFAKTASSTNTTIEKLGATMKYAAPIAHTFGMTLEDVSAAAGLMANAGIKGEMAGTALRASLLRMAKPTAEMQEVMDALGISFTDNTGKMKGMSQIVKMLETSFSGLTEADKLATAQILFGTEAASAWIGLIGQGSEAYDELAASLYGASGAAEEMSKVQLDNLAGDMTLLQSAVDGMKISLMQELNPHLRSGVQWLTGKIPGITDKLIELTNKGISKAKELKDFLKGIFDSSEYQNADGFAEKFFIAWDKIIAEPFDEWWSGNGQGMVLGLVEKTGSGLGQVSHGIIAGIFAALKGEEIDFEGMNLTGLAKAGAKAAKTFVEAFKDGFDLGGLWDDSPGLLKAGAIGFGTFKIGGGALGLVKTISQIKTAFAGTTTTATAAAAATGGYGAAAATAAAGTAKAATALSAVKVTLSSIPVWGVLAAAALTAATVAFVAWSNAQKEHERDLLNTGKAAAQMAQEYSDSVEKIADATDSMETIKKIKLQIEEDTGGNQTVIDEFNKEMDDIENKTVCLTAILVKDQATPEMIQAYQSELEYLHGFEAIIEGIIDKKKATPEDITAYQDEMNKLEGRIAYLKGEIDKSEADPALIAAYQTELDALLDVQRTVGAVPAVGRVEEADITKYQGVIDKLQGREVEVNAALNRGTLTDEAATALQGQINGLNGKTVDVIASLNDKGYNQAQMTIISAQVAAIQEGEKKVTVTIASNTSIEPSKIAEYVSELTSLMAQKSTYELTISGHGLTPAEITARKDALAGIKSRLAIVTTMINKGQGTMSDKEWQDLLAEAATLQTQAANIQLELKGAEMNDTEINNLKTKLGEVEGKAKGIFLSIGYSQDSDISQDELNTIIDDLANIGLIQATLDIGLKEGSMGTKELEELTEQLKDSYATLVETSGGYFTASDVENGFITQERYDNWVRNQTIREEAKRRDTRTKVENDRENIAGLVAQREAASAASASYNTAAGLSFDDLEELDTLDALRADLYSRFRADKNPDEQAYAAEAQKIIDRGAAYEWSDDFGAAQLFFGQYLPEDLLYLDNPFGFVTDEQRRAVTTQQEAKAAAESEAAAANAALVQHYQNEVRVTELDAFAGFGVESTNSNAYIQELAASYNTLDAAGQQMFANAIAGIAELNSTTDYITDAEKVDVGEILGQASQSVEVAANVEVFGNISQELSNLSGAYDTLKATLASTDPGDTEAIANYQAQLDAMDASNLTAVNEALEALGLGKIDSLADLGAKLQEIAAVDPSGLDFTAAAASLQALGGDATTAQEKVAAAKAQLEALAKTWNVTIEYNTIGSIPNTVPGTRVEQNANGGIYDGAFLSWVAEDGPEAIIPLGSARRERGLDLWLQAGEMLGVHEFADGGIMAPYSGAIADLPDYVLDDEDAPAPISVPTGNNGSRSQQTIEVSIDSSPTFEIKGGSPDDIMDALKSHMKELAELLGAEFAEQISDIVLNLA